MHELTSIAFSHYVEKARWALERFGVPYVDHRYLPFMHFAFMPEFTELPDSARSLIEELRATPAGAHALRMFREERRRVLPGRAAA